MIDKLQDVLWIDEGEDGSAWLIADQVLVCKHGEALISSDRVLVIDPKFLAAAGVEP